MTDLSIDASVSVGGLNADDGAASGRALLDLGTVGGAVVEDGLVVVDIGDEDDDDGRRRVRRPVAPPAGRSGVGGPPALT